MSENRYTQAKEILNGLSKGEIEAIAEEAIVAILRDEQICLSLYRDASRRESSFDKGSALSYSLTANRCKDNVEFLKTLSNLFRQS